jgi:uncharacterized protein with PIN domain
LSEATLRFYGALVDFLPREPRHQRESENVNWARWPQERGAVVAVYIFDRPVSVKDAIESIGVPHPEIDLVLANGVPVDFSYRLQAGDRIAVYPLFRSIDILPVSLVRPPQLDALRFVLDCHLGRLAAYLRLAGFDTDYRPPAANEDDGTLAEISGREDRILLTRDVALLKRLMVRYGYWVRETNPRRQLAEVAARFDIGARARPFTRCLRCNTSIEPVRKETVLDLLPRRTRLHYDEFLRCSGCGRIYWKGAHYAHLRRVLEALDG